MGLLHEKLPKSLLPDEAPRCRRCNRLFERYDGTAVKVWRYCARCISIFSALGTLGALLIAGLAFSKDLIQSVVHSISPKDRAVAVAPVPPPPPATTASPAPPTPPPVAPASTATVVSPLHTLERARKVRSEVATVRYELTLPPAAVSRSEERYGGALPNRVVESAPPLPSLAPADVVKLPNDPAEIPVSSPVTEPFPEENHDELPLTVRMETVVTPRPDPAIRKHAESTRTLFTPSVPLGLRPAVTGRCIVLVVSITAKGDISSVSVASDGGIAPFVVNQAKANARHHWRPAESVDGTPVAELATLCYCWPASDVSSKPHCP